MAILKSTRRLRVDMPVHHTKTTAGNNRYISEVCGYRLTKWVFNGFGQSAFDGPRKCAHEKSLRLKR